MKKSIAIVLTLALLLCAAGLAGCGKAAAPAATAAAPTATTEPTATAAPAAATAESTAAPAAKSISVYVTISDAGKLAEAREPVDVTDIDGDGVYTLDEVFTAAHDALYTGGAAAGYATATGDYGLSVTKLWGVENGGNYGYCVNNVPATGLTDPVKEGDNVVAYSYADLTNWTDAYSYFDQTEVSAKAGEPVALKLTYIAYDANWKAVETAAEGAVITVDGTKTAFVTGADGTAEVTFDAAGTYVVSAESDAMILVPPVCIVTVG